MCKKCVSFSLELPSGLVASLNSIYAGSHWRTRQQIKRNYLNYTHRLCKDLFALYGAFDKPCEISFEFSGTRIHDCDNHAFMGKMIQDCLVNAGLFKGDSAKYIAKVSYAKIAKKPSQKAVMVRVDIREL